MSSPNFSQWNYDSLSEIQHGSTLSRLQLIAAILLIISVCSILGKIIVVNRRVMTDQLAWKSVASSNPTGMKSSITLTPWTWRRNFSAVSMLTVSRNPLLSSSEPSFHASRDAMSSLRLNPVSFRRITKLASDSLTFSLSHFVSRDLRYRKDCNVLHRYLANDRHRSPWLPSSGPRSNSWVGYADPEGRRCFGWLHERSVPRLHRWN